MGDRGPKAGNRWSTSATLTVEWSRGRPTRQRAKTRPRMGDSAISQVERTSDGYRATCPHGHVFHAPLPIAMRDGDVDIQPQLQAHCVQCALTYWLTSEAVAILQRP